MERRGWHRRGYLPHIDIAGRPQFITWRLEDSLPISVQQELKLQLDALPEAERTRERWSRIEKLLDQGMGSAILKQPMLAREVQRALFHGHLEEYVLHAYCVMPNHVHVLCTPLDPYSLSEVQKRLKGRSARWVNKARAASGSIWDTEPYDRYMRDQEHFARVHAYIEWNPVKAGLCQDPAHWAYSSAYPLNRQRLSEAAE